MAELVFRSIVRAARAGLARVRAGIPPWVRPFWSESLFRTRVQAAWTAVLGVVSVAVFAVQLGLPWRGSVGVLGVVAVLLESWIARCSLMLVVVGLAVVSQVGYVLLGDLEPVAAGARIVTVVAVAMTSRLGALGWAYVRDTYQHEMTAMMSASHALGAPVDLAGVGAEAVRAAAGTVALPGLAEGRPTALLRVERDLGTLVTACDSTGVELSAAAGSGVPLSEVCLETIRSGRAVVATAGQVPPRLRELAGGAATGALALARVSVAGEAFGLLAVGAPHPGEFRREDLRLLDGIARVTGLAMATALRNAELRELKRRLQHGVELALEVGRSLEPAEVVASTLVRATESVRADRATLAFVDGDDLVVDSTYWAGGGGHPVAVHRHFSAESVEAVPGLARALAAGQPVMNGPLDAEVYGRELAGALADGRHTLLLPLVVAGRTSCVLVLARHRDLPFGRGDLARLEPMADIALLALRNAHLYARAEHAQLAASTYSGRLQLAIEAAEDIGSSQELSEVLDRALRRAVAVVHAEQGSISRVDGERMVVESFHDPTGTVLPQGVSWLLSDSRLGSEAVRARRPMRGDRASGIPADLQEWATHAGIDYLIACPLTVGREVVGLLGLTRSRRPFSDADLLTLQPFATLAGLLLRNARLLAEARQAGQAKSAFLNLAAHELRTPLAVIRGYLSMLDDGTYPVPEETREQAVRVLVSKAHELEALVEALLTSARLEVGGVPCAPCHLDIVDAVRRALDRITPRARLEGSRIDAILPERELTVRADEAHVARILDNLLNNALTYSDPPARVTITLRVGQDVQVVVEDCGMGIPIEQHERVFERFYRLEDEASRFCPGFGLGLPISRELAQMNDGSLLLERSEPGGGSVFVLRLPAARQSVLAVGRG